MHVVIIGNGVTGVSAAIRVGSLNRTGKLQ